MANIVPIEKGQLNWHTPLNENIEALNQAMGALLRQIYPVGCYYMSSLPDRPEDVLGFGTWERIKGRMIVGVDENDASFDTAGKTGGSKAHTLTMEQIPNHNFSFGTTTQVYSNQPTGDYIPTSIKPFAATASRSTIYTNSLGGGQAHNNMPPYETAYIWKRTA